MQIVTAVNAYYTEYGKYPLADLRHDLRPRPRRMRALQRTACHARATQNPRQIVFSPRRTRRIQSIPVPASVPLRRRPIFRSLGKALPH